MRRSPSSEAKLFKHLENTGVMAEITNSFRRAQLEELPTTDDPVAQPAPTPGPIAQPDPTPDPAPVPADPAPADRAPIVPAPAVPAPAGWRNLSDIHGEEWMNNTKCVMVPRDFILSKKSVIAFDFKSDILNHIRREEAKENDFFFRVVDVDSTIVSRGNQETEK
eukprot:g29743.t1